MRYLIGVLTLLAATLTALPGGATADSGGGALADSGGGALAAPGYPSRGAGTDFLDHDALLAGYAEPEWFKANIPFVELPDQEMQRVYYYRWRVWKSHLQWTNSGNGYILTEFLNDPGYGAAYGGINAAAGHHIYEGRWVRDRRYLDDYIRYWLYGAGYHRRHQYSFWAADSIYRRALVTGDLDFVTRLQPWLVSQYRGWDDHFNPDLGLYWQTPLLDATEYNYVSYQSSDPFAGGAGYRPTINAYQYADALAISRIARLNGDIALSDEYANRAAALKARTQRHLWDANRRFFFHMMRDDNPGNTLLDGRELAGLVPWAYGLPDPDRGAAWAQLKDPQGFAAPYGPTTGERRHRLFMYEAHQGCCRWDGPSWPYQTSQVLMGMAKLLNDYPAQSHITRADYYRQLRTYTLTQFKDGQPYVAEAHDPDVKNWMYDTPNHSNHYLHSSYTDLVINGLLGFQPGEGDSFELRPLVPSGWDWFALENVPYHGHNITVLWDRTGARYGQGAGLRIYQDGALLTTRPDLSPTTVSISAPLDTPVSNQVNEAANPPRQGYPKPIASYTSRYDNAWSGIDGKIYYTGIPNTRWTSYDSPNPSDWYGVDLGRWAPVGNVRVHFYDDGGGVRVPTSYRVQYWNGGAWVDAPNQRRTPATPTPNARHTVTFDPVSTNQLRIVAPNRGGGVGFGIVELETWRTPEYVRLVNRNSGKCVDVDRGLLGDGVNVRLWGCNGTVAQRFELVPTGGGHTVLRIPNSGKVLDVDGVSTAEGANVWQWTYLNGHNQHWRLEPAGDGWHRIIARHSGKALDVAGCGTADGTNIRQWTSLNNPCQHFRLEPA